LATFGIALGALLAMFRYVVEAPWPDAAVPPAPWRPSRR
jgi:hypothetical protein